MKTLEEIAEKFLIRQGCQRMDCDGENCNFFEDVQPKDLIEFAKWQQERMYSEEDLKNAFDYAREFNSLDGVVDVHIVLPMGGDMSDLQPLHFTFEEWFEQFKNQ